MKRAVWFHRLAEHELEEARAYYEFERPALGRAFLDEVERRLRLVSEHPEAGRIVLGDVRRRILRRFP